MTNYKVDKIVKGNVSGIEKYGIFINLENFYTGLIHISEISNDYIKDIND
ncbi:MAG: S1 RNA-binding domain-containing protein, partial [Mollicutes bacterium]|nr:S1 RNA-binding domain-containing protein [Mollicutes bacterium]